jgi:putative flippase GtrA
MQEVGVGPRACVLIPAYQPSPQLAGIADALIARGAAPVVIVDDGSRPECRPLFDELATRRGVVVLRHAVNLGKGAALKTGINAILCAWPDIGSVVTADADGQHAPDDIARILESAALNRDALVLGSRAFHGAVPWRSQFGNRITRGVVGALIGQHLRDTQTGLRAIPASLLPHLLRLPSSGYDFELDMLIASKRHGIPLVEVPIETIYLDGNRSSHFNPLLDSMRIYFVLVRFASVSMLSALIDNAVFALAYWTTSELVLSQALARLASVAFNYFGVKKAVFLSRGRHGGVFARYLALVIASATMSVLLIRGMTAVLPVGVVAAKLIAETLLFFVNFVVERDWVFRKTVAVEP